MDEFTPEKIRRMLDVDERQLDRLLRLIGDILDVSRIRTGQLSVRPSRVDFLALAQKVVVQLDAQLRAANCEVSINAKAEVIGYWDEFRIEQVLINLLLNALRYGAGKNIDIEVESIASNVRFSVRDYGKGIAPEAQQRIFQQFERGVESRKGSGLGLGLFIVDQIVRAHNGCVYVSSLPEHGATFSVILPQRGADTAVAMQQGL